MTVFPLLIDVGWVPARHVDCCLDGLYKAMSENPDGEDATIWAPLADPWLRAHVEEVTRRFQAILSDLQSALSRALFGHAAEELRKADIPWQRWSSRDMTEIRFRLEQKPTTDYTLDDWLLLVEWLIARYLPEGTIESEAEYLTVKAALLGKMQATMDAQSHLSPRLEELIALVPTQFRAVPPRVLRPVEASILRIAKARAADNIENVAADTKHRMAQLVIEHVQASVLGQSQGTGQALEQRMFDEFGQLNRDFRRIAVTEIGEAVNQGVVAATPIGSSLKRMEAYRGACEFCQSINGKVYKVVDPAALNKNGATEVWVGKDQKGRSASPRRRVGNALVERTPNELWWPSAGLQHPMCRGSWVHVSERPPGVSQEYADWLKGMIAEAQANMHGSAPGS